jgi:hypothetical protein
VLDDGPAPLHPLPGMIEHNPINSLANPKVHGRDLKASPEDLRESGKSGILLPDHEFLRHADAVEKSLSVGVQAETHLIVDLAIGDAGEVPGNQESGGALADRLGSVRPGVHQEQLGKAHQGTHMFAPVQDV